MSCGGRVPVVPARRTCRRGWRAGSVGHEQLRRQVLVLARAEPHEVDPTRGGCRIQDQLVHSRGENVAVTPGRNLSPGEIIERTRDPLRIWDAEANDDALVRTAERSTQDPDLGAGGLV